MKIQRKRGSCGSEKVQDSECCPMRIADGSHATCSGGMGPVCTRSSIELTVFLFVGFLRNIRALHPELHTLRRLLFTLDEDLLAPLGINYPLRRFLLRRGKMYSAFHVSNHLISTLSGVDVSDFLTKFNRYSTQYFYSVF